MNPRPLVLQTGESKRSFIDERTLIGIGLRQHIYKKDKNYFDIAVGPFYEFESYPEYKFENINFDGFSQKTTRISFNIFSSVKLFENITSATTLYSFRGDHNENEETFVVVADQYIRLKINVEIGD